MRVYLLAIEMCVMTANYFHFKILNLVYFLKSPDKNDWEHI